MIKIDRNFSIRLKDNSLHENKGRKKVLLKTLPNRVKLIDFTSKQMLLKELEGQTIGIEEYSGMYDFNKNQVENLIKNSEE